MADTNVSWSRNPSTFLVDPNEKLFVFGYSCKIFRDDEKAKYIDQGKHLIPWMGDKTLMIDRYDVRGYLHDLKQYEPRPEGYVDPLGEEETLCDEERYRSLRSDMSEEQLYHEEELKRLRAAIAGDGAYHEIGFTYDSVENEKYQEPEAPKVEEPEDELYNIPEGLTLPKDMEVPYTMKIHAIIEKTALFVSEQGGQMEIIIKMKQHANPQFAFMHLDNPLYPYYKHLVKEIKSGSYKPIQVKKVSQSEDEDDDGHYLHPSLMAGKQEPVPMFTVPTINFRRSSDDSYSVLVRNLQQHFVDETPVESPPPQTDDQNASEGSANNQLTSYGTADNSRQECENSTSEYLIIPPPPDLQPIVDKMAEYVAKNGDDFEIIVKSRKDKRFDFLQPWHEFYNYYVHRRNHAKMMVLGNGSSQIEGKVNPSVNSTQTIEVHQNIPQSSVIQESGPVLYSKTYSTCEPEIKKEVVENNTITKEEFDALYSQDSQDVALETPPVSQEIVGSETSDSMDFLDSPTVEKIPEEEPKAKMVKVLKGPISFSLKVRDTDTPTDKTEIATLLDDSEGDSSEEGKAEKDDVSKWKKSTEEPYQLHQRRVNPELEVKPPKPNSEFLEAKHAEERIRDKLMTAARERVAQLRKEKQLQLERQKREEQLKKEKQQLLDQQRKEKQLQLERKRKAELFLKMLKKKNPDSTAVVSHILGSEKTSSGQQNSDFWSLPDTSNVTSPSGILFHGDKILMPSNSFSSVIPGIKTEWSSDSVSEHSGEEEPISMIGEKLSSDPETVKATDVSKTERKKKKKKHSRSKSRERSRSDRSKTRRSKNRHRSRSRSPPRNYKLDKPKKEKQLPAAYALTRSRSRSRSPRRYRPTFNHWNRRR